MTSPRPIRAWCLHAIRVGLVVAVAFAIHHAHGTRSQQVIAAPLTDLAKSVWQPLFPDGERVSSVDGASVVQDVDGERLGTLLQTSPIGDDSVGFSGPSNVLLAFGTDDLIIGARIASSGDTVDHVAAVNASDTFRDGWNGLTLENARTHRIDAVSGATLTSTAANNAVIARLGGEQKTFSRFPQPVSLEMARTIFPDADEIRPLDSPEQTEVFINGASVGFLIRPAWQGVELLGYQGPTDILIGLDDKLKIAGLHLLKSFDNEPYFGYILDDSYFQKVLIGKDFPSFHELDLIRAGVEGVSGATMTSMTIADTIQEASALFDGIHRPVPPGSSWQISLDFAKNVALEDGFRLLVIVVGCAIAFMRGRRSLGLIWPIVVLAILGIHDGLLLSEAMFVGWSRHGLTTAGGYGLIALAFAAFFFPVTSGRNVYCTHLCAHGAAQMLLRNRLPRQWRLPKWFVRPMRYLPAGLLSLVVVSATAGWSLNLVNLEAFDAYLWPLCGWIPLVIALAGLVASLFEPMAYCRLACPTGSLLDYLRRHRRSDRWTRVDWFASVLAATAWAVAIG